jgi:ADP-heptose:LPS heptosyltransferase
MDSSGEIIYLETWGGLGDCLLMTPAIKSLKIHNIQKQLKVFCVTEEHYQILLNNPYIDAFIEKEEYEENESKFIFAAYGNLLPSLIFNKKASSIICDLLKTPDIADNLVLNLSLEEFNFGRSILSKYKNPICINPSSFCSQNQEWSIEKWEQLSRNHPDLDFIQIGKSDEKRIGNTIDFRGQYSLREFLSILTASKLYIGMDSFFAHAASALNVPAIVLFGDSTPTIWGHHNNINIYLNYECSPCIDILRGARCPYGNKCMGDISVNEICNSIQNRSIHNL